MCQYTVFSKMLLCLTVVDLKEKTDFKKTVHTNAEIVTPFKGMKEQEEGGSV